MNRHGRNLCHQIQIFCLCLAPSESIISVYCSLDIEKLYLLAILPRDVIF